MGRAGQGRPKGRWGECSLHVWLPASYTNHYPLCTTQQLKGYRTQPGLSLSRNHSRSLSLTHSTLHSVLLVYDTFNSMPKKPMHTRYTPTRTTPKVHNRLEETRVYKNRAATVPSSPPPPAPSPSAATSQSDERLPVKPPLKASPTPTPTPPTASTSIPTPPPAAA